MNDTAKELQNAHITELENPSSPGRHQNIRMFGIIGSWTEADVITATIHNAVMQGCERVYLVDNDSPDDTVQTACAAGAILALSYQTDYYDESLRLRHMNDIVRQVSEDEPDPSLWWLFLDGDEFPHGPAGMTIKEYLGTVDPRCRVIGARFFNHYPSTQPHYLNDRHPLDFQPLCEEISLPMCASGHRKHPLLRYDKHGPLIEADRGFHLVKCNETVLEPDQPIMLHHFPFREEGLTRNRLMDLWKVDKKGLSRADASRDTHILARFRSMEAVYSQNWAEVVNFVMLDQIAPTLEKPLPYCGVELKPWQEMVAPEHQHVLRWYPMKGAWSYDKLPRFAYGDDTTYIKGMQFLDGNGTIEDWGCGFTHAKNFVKKSHYIGIDGSSPYADKIVDLCRYTSKADCIFMRHVLEHNSNWKIILDNAIKSFRKRMTLIIFTPFSNTTRQISTSDILTSIPVPDISFKKVDITGCFNKNEYIMEEIKTDTQYGLEYIFYIKKSSFLSRIFNKLSKKNKTGSFGNE